MVRAAEYSVILARRYLSQPIGLPRRTIIIMPTGGTSLVVATVTVIRITLTMFVVCGDKLFKHLIIFFTP